MGFVDFAGPLSSVIDVGGSFIQNDWNKRAAQRSMDFSERMSSSAYQRVVADMKAAGINPMLAYMQGGESSPGGTALSSTFEGGDIGHSARDLMRMKQELKAGAQNISESKSRERLNQQSERASIEEARKRRFEGDVAESQAFSAKVGLSLKRLLLDDFKKHDKDNLFGIPDIPDKFLERFESGPRRSR